MTRSLLPALLAAKAVLLVWGALGLWEYLVPSAGFGLQNPSFPPGTQLLHWILLLLTGLIFVFGFVVRWRHTPSATVVLYATLATLCFVETLDFGAFGGGPTSYVIMAGEYVVYVSLAFYLLRSRHAAERFGRNM